MFCIVCLSVITYTTCVKTALYVIIIKLFCIFWTSVLLLYQFFASCFVFYEIILCVFQKPTISCNGKMHSFLEAHCPVFSEKFWPTVWCIEARAQTIISSVFGKRPLVPYEKYVFSADKHKNGITTFGRNFVVLTIHCMHYAWKLNLKLIEHFVTTIVSLLLHIVLYCLSSIHGVGQTIKS